MGMKIINSLFVREERENYKKTTNPLQKVVTARHKGERWLKGIKGQKSRT